MNYKQGLTDREEMDIKPSVDVLNNTNTASKKTNALNIQVKKLIITNQHSPPLPTTANHNTPSTNNNPIINGGVLTPTNEVLPLNKPIIPLEKIIQVDKKHNKQNSQLNSKEDIDRLNVSKLFIEFHNASLLPYDVFINVTLTFLFWFFKFSLSLC